MVDRLRNVLEYFGTRVWAQRGDSAKGKRAEAGVIDAEDVRITEVTSAPEMVARAEDLAEARERLKQLSDTMYHSTDDKDEAKVKDALAHLLKSEGEPKMLSVKPSAEGDEKKAKDVLAPPVRPEIELKMQSLKISPETDQVEVKDTLAPSAGGAAAPAIPGQKTAEGEKKPKEGGDMLSDIFGREEEESNPLANLVASLPDASVKELLDEARELEVMLGEWRRD